MYSIAYFKDRPKRKAKMHLVSLGNRKPVCKAKNPSGLWHLVSTISVKRDMASRFLKMDEHTVCGNCLKKVKEQYLK